MRTISKAVVIGAGTMGSAIAAQIANSGLRVHLLDMPASEPDRNAHAAPGLQRIRAAKPPLLYLPAFADRITLGNTEDDLPVLAGADWIVEAVAERMDVKQSVMRLIEAHSGPDTIVSSNTSGLSLTEMVAGCSHSFRARFLGSHFLNPPRYVKLLELIPTADTDPGVLLGFHRFAEDVLGQRVVVARDTPGFISTRLGIRHLIDTIKIAIEQGITIEEADFLTGPLLGRPRTGTFRLADLIGLDILAAICGNQAERLPNPPDGPAWELPQVVANLLAAGHTGEKAGAGFYKREGRELFALDLNTGEYRPRRVLAWQNLDSLQKMPLPERLSLLNKPADARWAGFVPAVLDSFDKYIESAGPEIAPDALAIDNVMRWGFGWEIGPCRMRDLRRPNEKPYYRAQDRILQVRDFQAPLWHALPESPEYIRLDDLRTHGRTILTGDVATLLDLGDDVACLEFHTKMNTFRPELTEFVDRARARAESEFAALVIANQGPHFSAGYDLRLFLDSAEAGDFAAIDRMLHEIQHAFHRIKYSPAPVVAAPHGYTLGAGCELTLHCAATVASPELSIGLPEIDVGVIPAGGGTTQMLCRATAEAAYETDAYRTLARVFVTLMQPSRGTSAYDGRERGFLRPTDTIVANGDRRIAEAKRAALQLVQNGYAPPPPAEIPVLGPSALAWLQMELQDAFRSGNITEHTWDIAVRIARVLTGDDIAFPRTVDEEYLYSLERKVFLELIAMPKSIERMRHVLEKGTPLEN